MNAEGIIAWARAHGSEPRDARDAAHEGYHAWTLGLEVWEREAIHQAILKLRPGDRARQEVHLERLAFRETHGPPQDFAVVEDDIDADELLKNAESDSNPDDGPYPSAVKEVRDTWAMSAIQRLLDLRHDLKGGARQGAPKEAGSLFTFANRDEIAW